MNNTKKKRKISGKFVFNLAVVAISVYMIIYFFASEDGMIDLLSSPNGFSLWWVIIAEIVYVSNVIIDTVVTLIMVRSQFKHFRFIDALKVAFVGVFFGAITPSNTGGQPMQLYLMAKINVGVGFGSACMTQKFIIYQIITTTFSMFAVVVRFDYFKSAFTGFWSTMFVVMGFSVQLIITAIFLIISFSERLTNFFLRLIKKLMHRLKFIKNPDSKMDRLRKEVASFHRSNKFFLTQPKMLIALYLLVVVQVIMILSVPYLIYIGFDMPQITQSSGETPASLFDFICIQSFVLFTSNLVPLPGASGGAELAFTMYFAPFFVIGGVNKIKPAILIWRFVTYYGAILISLPFTYYTKDKKREMVSEAFSD